MQSICILYVVILPMRKRPYIVGIYFFSSLNVNI